MKRTILLLLASIPALAQHPRILLDSTTLSSLRTRAAASDSAWVSLKAQCDAYLPGVVRPPKTTTGRYDYYALDYAYEVSTNPNIGTGYQGGGGGTINGYWDASFNLSLCYQMTISGAAQDLTAAANYAAKAKDILDNMTLAPATMLINTGTKAGITRYVYDSSFAAGTAWASGTAVVNGDVVAGATTMPIRGLTASGTILAGDVFVAGGNVYIAKANTSANGSGVATVTLGVSQLRSPISNKSTTTAMADGTAITTPFVVLSNRHLLAADGVSVTISGVTGNTNVNGTWTVTRVGGEYGYLLILDGSDGRTGSLQTSLPADPLYNQGYGARFYGTAMAVIYDWLYDELSSDQRTAARDAMRRWIKESERVGYGQRHVAGNYYAGQSAAKLFAALAMEQEDARGVTLYNEWIANEWSTTARQYPLTDSVYNCPSGGTICKGIKEYFTDHLPNTFHPDGSNYGWLATQNYLWMVLALKSAGKFDVSASPTNWIWHEGVAKALVYATKPNRTTFDTRTKIFNGTDPSRLNGDTIYTISFALRQFGSAFAPYFQSYLNTVKPLLDGFGATDPRQAYNGKTQWNTFMAYDSAAATTDHTGLALSFTETGAGFWHSRSDWSNTAVLVDLLGGPNVHSTEGGKDTRDRGGLTISRGDPAFADNKLIRFVTNAYHELAKRGQVVYADDYTIGQNTPGIQNTFFVNSGQRWRQGQYGPGDPLAACNQLTDTNLSRSSSGSTFSFARASELQDMYYPVGYYTAYPGQSSICGGSKPMTSWTRDVLHVLPKLVLVYDRVRGVTDNSWDRYMGFSFIPTPASASAPTGMSRYDVTNGSTFAGAAFGIKPDNHTTTLVNVGNFGYTYRVEYRPPAPISSGDHNFFFAFDAASSSGTVYTLVKQSGTNADAVQISELNTVAAFAQDDTPTLPLSYNYSSTNDTDHIVVGLAASTSYGISASAGAVTISSGGSDGTTDAAGVLSFGIPAGGGGAQSSIQLAAAPASLSFSCQEGGSNPSNQTVALTSNGGTAAVSASDAAAWTTLTLSGGAAPQDTPQTLTVAVDCTGLVAASSPYSASISVSSATSGVTNSPITIPINLVVSSTPLIAVSQPSMTFTTPKDASPAAQTFTATRTASGDFSISDDAAWLSVSPTSDTSTTSTEFTVTVDASGLGVGTYDATITVTSPSASNSPLTVSVTLTVEPLTVALDKLNASATASGVILRWSLRGLLHEQPCTYVVSDTSNEDQIAAGSVSNLPADRSLYLSLPGSGTYRATVECGLNASTTTFTAPSGRSNVTFPWSSGTPGVFTPAYSRLQYGGTSALGSTSSVVACTADGACAISLTRDSGVIYVAQDYCSDSACNTVLASTPVQAYIVK